MSVVRQRTISRPVTLQGCGVHSGASASITFHPAEPDSGMRFRRTDLEGGPVIPADLDHVVDTDLGTTLAEGEARVHTVEHVMASVAALGISNVLIDLDGPEAPIRDGSFNDYVVALDEAGRQEQTPARKVISVSSPITATGSEGQSYVALPGDELRISATIDFSHESIGRQYGSFTIGEGAFRSELAPARTFGFMSDAEVLRARGLARGSSLENSVVLDHDGVMNGGGLRFPDEFLRHKVGDMVGDLALLGGVLDAHVVAERPSHSGNIALAQAIRDHARRHSRECVVDVAKIMQYLPHRYPMLLVDRITEYEDGKRIVGIKNVTINEPFFQGHYPGHPIMPGVLIIEAMAQVGGLLLLEKVEDPEHKVVYFMTMDKVKWRRPVTPGDTLVFEVEILQHRRHTCKMKGLGFVDGQVVAEAEFMARIVDK
ncbi:MAG: bifunctional UDP-3-O-[3-hydroxymyristoyl] N-acetylglucosamine deacetylase/3-hydroxyacyl-ACP dehydratase [Gemmatimonadota bacterium]